MKKTDFIKYWFYSIILMSSFSVLGNQNKRTEGKAFLHSSLTEEVSQSINVDEILDECKDLEISAPIIKEPSALEIFGREWGIYLAYKCYEFRYVIGLTLFCAACYKLKSY